MYVIQSLIAGSAVFAVSELRAMKESLEQLNQKMPVIILQSSESRKLIDENKSRINALDDKVITIEKNQVLMKALIRGR